MVSLSPAQASAKPRAGHDHIVDVLIEERAPTLSSSWLWPMLRPALYGILDYGKARRMADALAPLPGREALNAVSELLSVRLDVRGLERVPKAGRLIVICNHPTGIADGIAVYDALRRVRPDIVFYANADALRVSPDFGSVLIPVEWVEAKRTRERTRATLAGTKAAMEAEQVLVVFPAGRIARVGGDGVARDLDWMPTALSVARKYEAPVLPIHVSGPHPTLFHFFHRFSTELRDMTLFHELLNKRNGLFRLTIGPLIGAGVLDGEDMPALKAYVEQVLKDHPDRSFP
jgi:putative hemolysin